MSEISFRDIRGQRGFITEDLEVEYSGTWKRSVTRCVDRAQREVDSTDGNGATGDLFDQLIIEMPERLPIVAVEREGARLVTENP